MSFFSSKVSVRKSDKLFSEYVRKRDGDCQSKRKCFGHKTYEELQCCHFHSRRKESTRFDPECCVAMCVACHQYADTNVNGRHEFERTMLERLGQQRFDLLQMRSETLKKRDDAMDILYCKELLKELPQ